MDEDTVDILTELTAYLSVFSSCEQDALLRLVMDVGVGLVRAAEGSLLLIEPRQTALTTKERAQMANRSGAVDRRELVFRMTVGSDDSAKRLAGQRMPLHEGIVGWAASTGEAQTGKPRYHGIKMSANEPSAVLAAPIACGEEIVGVLTAVKFTTGAAFTPEDAGLYTRFGAICGLLLEQRAKEEAVLALLSGRKTSRPGTRSFRRLLKETQGSRFRAVAEIANNIARVAGSRVDLLNQYVALTRAMAEIAASSRSSLH